MAKNSAILDPKARKAAAAEAKKVVADLKKQIKANADLIKQADKNKLANLKAVEAAYKEDTAEPTKANKGLEKELAKAESRLAELTAETAVAA